MIYSDNIIEKSALWLRNLNANGLNTASDTWSSALTGYGFYNIPFEIPLAVGHVYYSRATYKFTTTNQSPTWCTIYAQGGTNGTGGTISNPTANTEYTISGIWRVVLPYTVTGGCIYNGNYNAIAGVSSYVKNVLVYDVTNLYTVLLAKGTVSSDATMKTWCDTNLVHKPKGINYDVSSLVGASNNKIGLKNGAIVADEFIEADGMKQYSINATVRDNTYFDSTTLPFSVYNNSGGGTVTHTRIEDTTSPFYPEHKYVCKIVTNGTASPYAGGFVCSHNSAANKIFIERFVAKAPAGYNMTCHYNPQGTGSSVQFITDTSCDGTWKEYAVLYKCGSEGSFSSGGHIAINGSNNTSVTWYVAYVNNCDITGKEYLKNYQVLSQTDKFTNNYVYSREFNTCNLIPNGNCAIQETAMLPSGWSYDTTDYPTDSRCHAKCSIVQPVNAGSGTFGGVFKINPLLRYKVSYWVKCKQDMTSFLTACYYYTAGGAGFSHRNTVFKNGTLTQLTADLKNGDTTVTVKSNANWAERSYSNLGFRSNSNKSYSDLGTFGTHIVSGITSTTIINLASAYTGNTITSGTYIVEGYDGGNYPYPIGKGSLPTDNTWKYVEGYFGTANTIWSGNDNIGSWGAIPWEVAQMGIALNIYANTGTVPIKFADIRVEPVAGSEASRVLNKVQFTK